MNVSESIMIGLGIVFVIGILVAIGYGVYKLMGD